MVTKEYHVEVDPFRLKGQGVSLPQVSGALANANQNVGGQRLTLGEQSYDVRGVGLIRSLRDIDETTVVATKGVPSYSLKQGQVLYAMETSLPRVNDS